MKILFVSTIVLLFAPFTQVFAAPLHKASCRVTSVSTTNVKPNTRFLFSSMCPPKVDDLLEWDFSNPARYIAFSGQEKCFDITYPYVGQEKGLDLILESVSTNSLTYTTKEKFPKERDDSWSSTNQLRFVNMNSKVFSATLLQIKVRKVESSDNPNYIDFATLSCVGQ